ncbi:hypothetical protein J1614_009768 [Plenodomus biglobosus]|nr:hypothetical protein J1614_009768 [Plenodomus biglobosus]
MEGAKVERQDKILKSLYATFGEQDLYNAPNFKPQTRNLTTGHLSARGHHCDQCAGKLMRSCYERFHHAFCPTWVTGTRGGKGVRERCGERLAILSGGCGEHSRVKGYNSSLYRLAEGHDVKLSDFDDDDDVKPNEEQDENNQFEDDTVELNDLAEAVIQQKGFLPGDFFASYRSWRDKQERYARDRISSAEDSMEATEGDESILPRDVERILKRGNARASNKRKADSGFCSGALPKSVQRTRASHGGPVQQVRGRRHGERTSMEIDRTDTQSTVVDIVKLTAKERVAEWWAKREQEEA